MCRPLRRAPTPPLNGSIGIFQSVDPNLIPQKQISLRQSKAQAQIRRYVDDSEARSLGSSLFHKLDADGSGHLCKEELVQARRVMLFDRYNVTEAARKIDTSADTDNDGLVDQQEWHAFVGSLYELIGRSQFMGVLQGWTQDADGKPQHASAQSLEHGTKKHLPRPEPKARPAWGATAKPKAPERKGWGVSSRTEAKTSRVAETKPMAPVEGPLSEEEAALKEAALKIQSNFRGTAARKVVDEEKLVKEKAVKKSPKEFDEQPVATVAEVWDMLTTDRSFRGIVIGLEISDILDLYLDCKESGLDMDLAHSIPMHFASKVPPENVTTEEVIHLCIRLLNRREAKMEQDMTEYDARVELEPIKESLREIGDRRGNAAAQDIINLRIWRQLIPILAALLQIDVDLITSHWAWTRGGRFELPPVHAAYIMACCARKGQRWKGAEEESPEFVDAADGLWASLARDDEEDNVSTPDDSDLSLLRQPFTLNEFMLLCHNGGIVDSRGKVGMTIGDLQLIYKRVQKNMPDLLKARSQYPQRDRPKTRGDERGLVGRAEFEVLLEELAKAGPFPRLFKAPLHMAACLTKAAREKLLYNEGKTGAATAAKTKAAKAAI